MTSLKSQEERTLTDYVTSRLGRGKLTKLSIHDIPQNVTEDEIAQWVDTFAKRETDVKKHTVKKDTDNKWNHLLTGHIRVCFRNTRTQAERYTIMSIADPRDAKRLSDIPVHGRTQDFFCRGAQTERLSGGVPPP